MKNSSKQRLLDTSVTAVKIVLCVLFAFVIFLSIYYGMINKADVPKDEPLEFIESWTVTDNNGKDFTTDRSYVSEELSEYDYTIRSTLPQDIKNNEYLFFETRKDTAVFINGELRKDFVVDRDVNVPGGAIKRFYMMVPLGESDSGAEVKMEIKATINDDLIVPESFISTRYGAFSYMVENGGLSLFLASIVLIFSFVVFVVSVILRIWYKLNIDMMYGALSTFVISAWLVTDSTLLPFLFGESYVGGLLNYIFCLMIPFAPCIYLNSVQKGRYKNIVSVVMIVSCINAILWPTLHMTGILHFYNIRNVVNLILVLLTLTAITLLITDAVRGYVSEYKYTFIGFFGFLVCCIVELSIILFTSSNASLPMVIGLGFLLAFVVIQQVDDLRKINIEKQHAIDISEAKTRFLASMSHEIRTPINAILGMNEMILRENNDKVIGEYSRSIKTSGKMLLMLVNDVLDFSKIEAGKLEITETRFLMSEMLFDVISLVKERADEKTLELKTEITAEIPNELISDEFRIRQILVNLMNNAVKYTDKGTVTLILGGSPTENGFELSMVVKDTGKGIRKEDQADLFEAFSRADAKAIVNIEGTGLGLAIVKSIVDSMNGALGVESEYGVGSEFWVKLPVKCAGSEPLNSDFMESRSMLEEIDDTCTFTAPNAKVLAVDDNQSNLTIVKLFLKRTGIKPDLCSTGTNAIELCKEKKYDLILLDHMMPQPDGIETLHIIRSDAQSLNRETKAVVLTANAVAGSRQMYIDEGFDDYLSKPLDSKMLEQTVKNMLPKNKVTELSGQTSDNSEAEMPAETSPLKQKLTSIEGLDYDTALSYCGGDEDFLAEIIHDVASGCAERADRMKKSLAEKDIDSYRIDAHTVKSNMATLGLDALSERAKKHEFAAKNNDTDFIFKDAEGFINEYIEVCEKLI